MEATACVGWRTGAGSMREACVRGGAASRMRAAWTAEEGSIGSCVPRACCVVCGGGRRRDDTLEAAAHLRVLLEDRKVHVGEGAHLHREEMNHCEGGVSLPRCMSGKARTKQRRRSR